jgi:hypothetical protein
MESQFVPSQSISPHPDDIRRSQQLVRAYDGDQADGPCIDVCGYFLYPEGDRRGRIIEGLQKAIAKELSAARQADWIRHTAPQS